MQQLDARLGEEIGEKMFTAEGPGISAPHHGARMPHVSPGVDHEIGVDGEPQIA